MNISKFLIIGLTLLAAIGHAVPALPEVPFKITSQEFEAGDEIIIESVFATSPELKIGDTVVVRGRYRLATRQSAMLGFFLTTNGPSEGTPVSPRQRADIKAGEGTFVMEHVVPALGRLHVSFYGAPRGGSFGEIYFGPAKR